MTTVSRQRIARQRQDTRLLALWRELQLLRTVVSFMNSGAHPDDETSSMLAALGLRDGLQLSYACANRGEGGQNEVGTETSIDLGVLRTAEMEQAADVLGMRLYWLSQHPQDSVFDFGFSKSGIETLANWNHDRALQRFVDIIRIERPDILCPTFLDIPGQHGHHRAMTQLADEVFDAAADPAFASMNRAAASAGPWQIKKLFLPAWSGAGDAYDDDLPPPPATLIVDANGIESPSGWSWAQIAQHSRACHVTQGMGAWVDFDVDNSWPLHLKRSAVDSESTTLISGIAANLSEMAEQLHGRNNTGPFADALQLAQQTMDTSICAWPDFNVVEETAFTALAHLQTARRQIPAQDKSNFEHRLLLKQTSLAHIIRLARGIAVRAQPSQTIVAPGSAFSVAVTTSGGTNSASLTVPDGWAVRGDTITVANDAPTDNGYPDFYDPRVARLPALQLSLTQDKRNNEDSIAATTLLPLQDDIIVTSTSSATLMPASTLINRQHTNRSIDFSFGYNHSAKSTAGKPLNEKNPAMLQTPAGWNSVHTESGCTLTGPADPAPGLLEVSLELDGVAAQSLAMIRHPHIGQRARCYPAQARIRVVDAKLPQANIAYVGGGNDRVAHWLRELGLQVTELDDSSFSSGNLQQYQTLVVGVFAMRTRPALCSAMPLIHEWIENGGNFLTLYHRPWDAWDPDCIPPRHLSIGKPSLRWRVTDENATVTHLLPQHPLLQSPNVINEQDWHGWHKERGLYFAMQWDDTYEALLSMADPDEKPHTGALLSARVGAGRHTHTSLILHHQMNQLVPGAFRLMANLVAPTS